MGQNKKIKLGKESLEFAMEGKERAILYNGKSYKYAADLLEVCPQLLQNETDLSPYASVLNYLLFGDQFYLISEVDKYNEKYWARKIKESQEPNPNPDIAKMWLADYNLSYILPPVKDGTLFFCFLEHSENGLPFLLTTPFPIKSYVFDFNLQPVPFVTEGE